MRYLKGFSSTNVILGTVGNVRAMLEQMIRGHSIQYLYGVRQ